MLNILGYGSANQTSLPGGSSTSPFAQMLTQLQQLEQSNPAQYSQVSGQISAKLSGAASSAQSQGNSKLATQLTTLSKDFATASQTGQLPDVVGLAKMLSGTGANTNTSSGHHGVLKFVEQAMNLFGV